jgi:methionyl-tRNA formyltransferase
MSLSRLIFMGTPEFACPSLKVLLEKGEEVLSVYTQPDRPKGRGKKPFPPPVKALALSRGLPVFQPLSLKDRQVQQELAEQKPDLLVVVAYGLLLPPAVLDIPSWGAVNVHASLLPKYRGAAPIPWALLNGEKETGVTTMRLDAGMDTGDILLQEKEPIGEEDTAQDLHDRLSWKGAHLLLETLRRLRAGDIVPRPQDHSRASYAPPLTKAAGEIPWDLPAEEIERRIRAFTPWPGAYTFFQGRRLLIHRAAKGPEGAKGTPGTVISLTGGRPLVQTGKGLLIVLEAQWEGHKRLAAEALVRGQSFFVGQRLGR